MGAKWFYSTRDNKYYVTDKFGKLSMFIKDGGQIGSDWSHEIQPNPNRMLYFQRTHVGTITAGKSMTGMMISQTFKGTADSGNIDGLEVKSRGNATRTDHDLDNVRAIVANTDTKKTDVTGIARCIEAVLESSNPSTITEARAINGKIQCSGTVTTGYVGYFEGHSGAYADYGLYVRYCTTGLTILDATDAIKTGADGTTGGNVTFYGDLTSSYVKWDADANRLTVQATMDAAGEIGTYEYGMYIGRAFDTAIPTGKYVAGLKIAMEGTGDYDSGAMIFPLWIDVQNTGTNSSDVFHMILLQSQAGACIPQSYIYHHVASPGPEHLWWFAKNQQPFYACSTGSVHGGATLKIKIDVEGTDYYLLCSTTPT